MEGSDDPGGERAGAPLVIGLGNEHRGDDRVGLDVLAELRRTLRGPARLLEGPGDFTALLDLWSGVDRVIVVDAVSSGAEPGTIHRIVVGAGGIPGAWRITSTHGGSLVEAVGLGVALGQMPGTLVLYGIEVEDLRPVEGLSPRVGAAVPRAVRQIADELDAPAPVGEP